MRENLPTQPAVAQGPANTRELLHCRMFRLLFILLVMWTLTLRGGASSLLSSLVRLGPSFGPPPSRGPPPTNPVMRLPLELTPKLVNDEASLRLLQFDLRELVSQPLLLLPSPSSSPLPSPWPEAAGVPLVNVVGIDCEWRPENYYYKAAESNSLLGPWLRVRKSLSRFWGKLLRPVSPQREAPSKNKTAASSAASPVQLLQISSRRSVWVLDLQTLCRRPDSFASATTTAATALTENEQLLNSVLASVLHAENVIKVGMGPAQDLKRLGWSYPWLSATLSHRAVLDVQSLAKRANPGVAGRDLEGLNKLCVRELGEGVDKSLQCSDWAQRPLSLPQLAYAGLDAVALVRLFDVLLPKAVDVLGNEFPGVSGGKGKKNSKQQSAAAAAQAPAQLQILAPLLFEYQLTMPKQPPPTPEQQGADLAPIPLRSMGATQSSMKGWLTRSVDTYAT